MRIVTVYYNFASKTSSGEVEIEDDQDIHKLIRQWISDGYCKVRLSSRHHVYVNWQNVVYVSVDHHHH